jgi:hypothetical protein
MKHLYGNFSDKQIDKLIKSIRSSIFFLLVSVDPETCEDYKEVDIERNFDSIMMRLNGLNKLLVDRVELVDIMAMLQYAREEYKSQEFDFKIYRKLILDAGAEVKRLREGE